MEAEARSQLLLLAFLFTACGAPKPAAPTPRMVAFCKGAGAEVSAAELRVEGNQLTIVDATIGSCSASALTVCWDRFLESRPVQVPLKFDAPTDCLAGSGGSPATLSGDLTELKAAYLDGYRTTTGTIILRAGATNARYEF